MLSVPNNHHDGKSGGLLSPRWCGGRLASSPGSPIFNYTGRLGKRLVVGYVALVIECLRKFGRE